MVLGFSPRTCAGGKPCPQVAGLNIRNTLQLWPEELLKPHICQNRKVFEINDAVGVQLSG
jgi:hypothetical protein